MSVHEKVVDSDKIWASLLTNEVYLTGLLTLNYSLRRVGSKYPLVVLHFGSLSDEAVRTLTDRGIPLQKVPYIYPGMPWPEGVAGSSSKAHDNEDANGNNTNGGGSTNQWYAYERFRDCFTKLAAFSLTAYSRIVLLDADMLVLRNMDDLFDVPLDNENRLFAATHACTCNPYQLPQHPRDWTPPTCAYTQRHDDPAGAQTSGGSPRDGKGELNSGLLVLAPSAPWGADVYRTVLGVLCGPDAAPPGPLPFADQSLLGLLFAGRWAPLPYVYNALRPMRLRRVHGAIWRDDEVRNVHYITMPKPWGRKNPIEEKRKRAAADGRQESVNEAATNGKDDNSNSQAAAHDADEEEDSVVDEWWWEVDEERRAWEVENGITS